MPEESLADWLRARGRTRILICDIDDTICTNLDRPIVPACRVLAALDRSLDVHYVTARPELAREATERFLGDYRLPGRRNVHYCPSAWKSSGEHKAEVIARLARQYDVIVSVGDNEDEQRASHAAGVRFLRVTFETTDAVWAEVSRLVREHATRNAS